MNRFKNILAVYNDTVGDDGALAQATAMAKRNDARLTVIEVDKDADALPTSACDAVDGSHHRHRDVPKCSCYP